MARRLFTAGTARGGTNLRAQLLSAHKDVCVASDPYLPLFREFRNAAIRQGQDPEALATLDPASPLADHYFTRLKRKMMLHVQRADLEIPFDRGSWPTLREALRKRTSLASIDLVPHLDRLPGPTFLNVFRNAVDLIGEVRRPQGCRWLGFNENWAVEFFVPLARAFPDARFMIHLRDPRGAIHGALYTEPDQAKMPSVVSFARHWRKLAAFAVELSSNPWFKDRLHISTYEALLADPDKHVKAMTDFLGIDFNRNMYDPRNFRLANGGAWPVTWQIYQSSASEWKQCLPPEIIETVEFICGPEMGLFGYKPLLYQNERGPSPAVAEFMAKEYGERKAWRSDFMELEKDMGFELFRRSLLSAPRIGADRETVERCFLFQSVFSALTMANQAALA